MFWAQGNEFSIGWFCGQVRDLRCRDEWHSMIATIGIRIAPYKAPLSKQYFIPTYLTYTAPIVLELVYMEFGADPSPS